MADIEFTKGVETISGGGTTSKMRTCISCDASISRCSKGRCRKCVLVAMNSDPEIHARRVAGIRRKYRTDPAYKARKVREIGERHLKARECPETAARLNRNIWIARERLGDADVIEKLQATRKGAGRKRTNTVFAWCPSAYRDHYRFLTKSKRMSAADAKAATLAKAEAEMTPFDRQLERVRNGAGISIVRPISRPEPTYTLGGVSSIDGATG